MNLVQINEHLKEAPLRALMAYANGQNPIVPAYMATGELKRREVMQQKQQQSQQAQQGQVPTVKEQVEQQAGLMALQAQQQKQAQQQLAQQAQAQPMPVPPQTPQPETQPQEESEFAYGGIAELPVQYDFASGGIIAFKEGDKVPAAEESEEEKRRRIQKLLTQGFPSTQGIAPPVSEPIVPKETSQPEAGLPSLMGPPAPPKAAPRPGEAEIPGLYDPQALDVVKQRLTPRTVEEIADIKKKAEQLAGVQGKYGEEQQKRLAQEEAQYSEMLKDRDFNRMLAVLSGMGRGGLGGAAPAYLQTQAAEQSADIAQKRRMNELYGNIEAKQREEALGKAKDIMTPYEAGVTQAGELAGKLASSQMSSQTEFAKEVVNNKNALDRMELQYKRDLEAAKQRFANEQELQKIREAHDFKVEELRKKNSFALEQFRQNAPTAEQKDFASFLKMWKQKSDNKGKADVDAFGDYYGYRLNSMIKAEKNDITGLKALQSSFEKQLENLGLPAAERQALQTKLANVNKEIEKRVMSDMSGGAGDVDRNNPLLK